MAPYSFMGEHARKYYNNLLPQGPPVWIDPTLHYPPSYIRNVYLPLDSRQQQQLLLRPPPLPNLPRFPPLPPVVYPAHRILPAKDYIPPSRPIPGTRPDSTPSFSSTSETTHNQPSAQPDPAETRPQSAELEANHGRRSRITFTPYQLMVLEEEFAFRSYLTRVQRSRLAYKLNLTDKQVKIWFQNRRTKQKKEEAEAQQLAEEVSTKVSLKAPQEAPPKVTQEGLPSIPLTQEVPTKASQEVPRKAHPKVTQEALPSDPLTQEVPTKFSREVLQEALQRIPREVYHELPRKVPQKISHETNCTTRRLLCDNVVHCACCRAGYKGL